jgi:hypothetical protein
MLINYVHTKFNVVIFIIIDYEIINEMVIILTSWASMINFRQMISH